MEADSLLSGHIISSILSCHKSASLIRILAQLSVEPREKNVYHLLDLRCERGHLDCPETSSPNFRSPFHPPSGAWTGLWISLYSLTLTLSSHLPGFERLPSTFRKLLK